MAKSIMIQGTMSSVGKSLLTAALCRIFTQDGYKTAPFKSQNMALNSFVTLDGFEIGRAQAMQAQAAKTEPSVLMNPILLKPTTNMGSQVIINGKAIGNMRAAEYFKRKKELIPVIINAYEELSKQYDIIVIEGAGSPAELNLKTDDIVNMGIAKLFKSNVLLAGDIDRGGIFAQLLGTLSLLEEDEQRLVKGLIVNKFRGDRSLFDDGVRILEERSKKPVVGVIPYIDCDIDDEDSLSDSLYLSKTGDIDIAVIKLSKISNFTDVKVFTQYSNVGVRYVENADDLRKPDMIIIPGTKSTISDMRILQKKGLDKAIKKCAKKGIPIFGICGGFQMLGKRITDSENAENRGETEGLCLLNIATDFSNEKTLERVSGHFSCDNGFFSVLNGVHFEGYEIHMGKTTANDKALIAYENGINGGAYRGNVCGAYVHGIFDLQEVSKRIVKALFEKKGISYNGVTSDRSVYREMQYDLLAESVRSNIDLNLIYRILEEKI